MDAWIIWLIAAAVLAGAEALSGDFVLIMLAGGAAAGGITQAASDSFILAVVIAAVVAFGLMAGVRPYARRRLLKGDGGRFGAERIIGAEAIATSVVDYDDGRVRISGQEWSARSPDPGVVYPAGARLRVFEIDGATAVVWHPNEQRGKKAS